MNVNVNAGGADDGDSSDGVYDDNIYAIRSWIYLHTRNKKE